MTFDQGRDVAVPGPGQEIAFPTIFNRCRPLTERELPSFASGEKLTAKACKVGNETTLSQIAEQTAYSKAIHLSD